MGAYLYWPFRLRENSSSRILILKVNLIFVTIKLHVLDLTLKRILFTPCFLHPLYKNKSWPLLKYHPLEEVKSHMLPWLESCCFFFFK